MKKLISIILMFAMLLSVFVLSSCGDENLPENEDITNEGITNKLYYNKIKFYQGAYAKGEPYYVCPTSRDELVEYLKQHKWFWYGCDNCRKNICFGSENKIPLEYMVALNVPFKYIPNESPDGVKETSYGVQVLNIVEIDYGADVDIELLAECIENMVQSGKVKSIEFFDHVHGHPEG